MATVPTITGTGMIFLINKYLSYVLIQNFQMIQGPLSWVWPEELEDQITFIYDTVLFYGIINNIKAVVSDFS